MLSVVSAAYVLLGGKDILLPFIVISFFSVSFCEKLNSRIQTRNISNGFFEMVQEFFFVWVPKTHLFKAI